MQLIRHKVQHAINLANKSFFVNIKSFLFLFDSVLITPLGPKSDQHQYPPNNVSTSSRVNVMRITKLITKGRALNYS